MTSKIKVYGAGLVQDARHWLELRSQWPEVHWTSTWPTKIGHVPEEPIYAKVFWSQNIDEVLGSDVLLLRKFEPTMLAQFRGALVEAGAALAGQIPVIVVGDMWEHGSWVHHPLVHQATNLDEARRLLELMSNPIAYERSRWPLTSHEALNRTQAGLDPR